MTSTKSAEVLEKVLVKTMKEERKEVKMGGTRSR